MGDYTKLVNNGNLGYRHDGSNSNRCPSACLNEAATKIKQEMFVKHYAP